MEEIYLRLLNLIVKYDLSDNLVLKQKKNKVIEISYKDHYVTSLSDVTTLITLLNQFDIDTDVSYFSASLISVKFENDDSKNKIQKQESLPRIKRSGTTTHDF
jgi:hypothetical protein